MGRRFKITLMMELRQHGLTRLTRTSTPPLGSVKTQSATGKAAGMSFNYSFPQPYFCCSPHYNYNLSFAPHLIGTILSLNLIIAPHLIGTNLIIAPHLTGTIVSFNHIFTRPHLVKTTVLPNPTFTAYLVRRM